MINAILAIGSNCGFKRKNIEEAIQRIQSIASVVASSSFYYSPDIKGTGHVYLNAVVEVDYDGSVEQLNSMLKDFEMQGGRDNDCRKQGLVPIDIDIVIADGVVLRQKDFKAEYFVKGFQELKSCS